MRKPFPIVPVASAAAALITIAAVAFALNTTDSPPLAKSENLTAPTSAPPPKVEPPARVQAELDAPGSAPVAAPVTPAAAATATSAEVERYNDEIEKMRLERGQALLAEAQSFAAQKPEDIKNLRKKLDAVVRSYRSTPAGEEAARLLAELPTPPLPSLDESVFANALNALVYIDLAEDKVAGEWEWINGELKIQKGRFMVPYDPGGEYDVRVAFTRLKSGGPLGLYLRPDGGKQFMAVLSIDDHGIGLSKLGGKSAHENPAFVRMKDGVATNKRHTLIAQIRKSSVRLFLDGQYATGHETDFKDLSLHSDRALKNPYVIGLFADNVPVLFHSFEIAEISGGKGKFIRGPVNMATSNAPVAAATAAESKDIDPVSALKSPASAYETAVWNAYTLAGRDGGTSTARASLEAARKDAALAPYAAALERDIQIVSALPVLAEATQKGLAALTDKRPFKLEKMDGKHTTVGKGSRLQIKDLKNNKIVLVERIGGASAESQLDLDTLTLACRMELARIGLGDSPEGAATLAAGLLLATLQPDSTIELSQLTAQLEQAARLKASAESIEHLKQRAAALERERNATRLFAEARELLNQQKNDDARARLAEFIPAALGTAAGQRLQDEARSMLSELKAREIKPGLWFAMFTGEKEDVFAKSAFSRAESRLRIPSLPKDAPRNYWGFRGGGLLRVETGGSYAFKITSDDMFRLFINDRKVGEVHNKKDATLSVTLAAGDNPLRFVFEQFTSNYGLSVKWKVPGSSDFTEIPESALWYDPAKTSVYEKAPGP